MKRTIPLLIALLALLAGCGSSGASTQTQSYDQQAAASKTAEGTNSSDPRARFDEIVAAARSGGGNLCQLTDPTYYSFQSCSKKGPSKYAELLLAYVGNAEVTKVGPCSFNFNFGCDSSKPAMSSSEHAYLLLANGKEFQLYRKSPAMPWLIEMDEF